jgi:hypothetical protein
MAGKGVALSPGFLLPSKAGAGSSVSPGGANTDVQFNDAGTFGGATQLTWDKTTNTFVASAKPAGAITLEGGPTPANVVEVAATEITVEALETGATLNLEADQEAELSSVNGEVLVSSQNGVTIQDTGSNPDSGITISAAGPSGTDGVTILDEQDTGGDGIQISSANNAVSMSVDGGSAQIFVVKGTPDSAQIQAPKILLSAGGDCTIVGTTVEIKDNSNNNVVASGGGNTIGFLNATPVVRQVVTGSRGGNAALASLLTALATLGLITDNSTP